MNKRRLAVAFCLMALATSAFALSGPPSNSLPLIGKGAGARSLGAAEEGRRTARENVSPEPAPGQVDNALNLQALNIPRHVIYGMLFKEAAFFKKKAREQSQKGEDGAFFLEYQKNKLKLHGAHAAAFDRVAEASARKMSKLDERAKRIIDAARAGHPEGKLKEGELPPAPPAELKMLDKERVALLTQAREELRAALGEAEFLRLENLLLEDAAKTIKPIHGGAAPASFARQQDPLTPPALGAPAKGGE